MTVKEIQKRNLKAESLRVIRTADNEFYVESSEGKISYKVNLNGKETCSCADYTSNSKKDPSFRCKHILAVMDCDGDCEQGESLHRKKAKLDERFISSISGRDFVLYTGLLDLAHQKGLLKLEVLPVQYPTEDNGHEAICRAVAESKTGEIFSDVGDANPRNCNKAIAQHIIRMASTRAKARALRDFTNVGMTCLEELGDLDEVIAGNNVKQRRPVPQKEKKPLHVVPEVPDAAPVKAKVPAPKPDNASKKEIKQDVIVRMSEAQKRAMLNLSKRRGISPEEIERMVREQYGVSIEDLSSQDAGIFIRQLQSVA